MRKTLLTFFITGMDNDNFNQIAANVSTVVDLLEDKGISWGTYQEDMPYSGFEGFSWVNQQTKANDYVRKHHPNIVSPVRSSVWIPAKLTFASDLRCQYHSPASWPDEESFHAG